MLDSISNMLQDLCQSELKAHLARNKGLQVGAYTYTRQAEKEIKGLLEKLGLRKFYR